MKIIVIDSKQFPNLEIQGHLPPGVEVAHYSSPELFILSVKRGEIDVKDYDLFLHNVEEDYPLELEGHTGSILPAIPWLMRRDGFKGLAFVWHRHGQVFQQSLYYDCGYDGFVSKYQDILGHYAYLKHLPKPPKKPALREVRNLTWDALLGQYFTYYGLGMKAVGSTERRAEA